jgi:Flp pilus assembly protein CpaB
MILLVVAVGCGLVASVMTSRLIAERGDGQEKMVKVLVTKGKIRQFDLIKEPQKLFVEKDMLESTAPKKAIRNIEDLRDKRVIRSLPEDTYVTAEDLVTKDLNVVADQLEKGSRAVAFRVSPESLAGGFVLPGTRVDILQSVRKNEKTTTRTIMQNMLVLAVDQIAGREVGERSAMLGNTVTMAVRPKEAQDLFLASTTGEIRLVLRPLGEDKAFSVKPSTEADLENPQNSGNATENTDPMSAENLGNLVPPPPIPNTPEKKEGQWTGSLTHAEKRGPESTTEAPVPDRRYVQTIIQGDHVSKVSFNKSVESDDLPGSPPKNQPATPGKSNR